MNDGSDNGGTGHELAQDVGLQSVGSGTGLLDMSREGTPTDLAETLGLSNNTSAPTELDRLKLSIKMLIALSQRLGYKNIYEAGEDGFAKIWQELGISDKDTQFRFIDILDEHITKFAVMMIDK